MKTVFSFIRIAVRCTASLLLSALLLSVLLTGLPTRTDRLLESIPDTPFFRYTKIGNYRGRLYCLGITFGINLSRMQPFLDRLNRTERRTDDAGSPLIAEGILQAADNLTQTLHRLFDPADENQENSASDASDISSTR